MAEYNELPIFTLKVDTDEIITTDAPLFNFFFLRSLLNNCISERIFTLNISSMAESVIFFTGIVFIIPAHKTIPSKTGNFSTNSSISFVNSAGIITFDLPLI